MVIRLVIQDCHGAIDLLDEDEADHLVGERHPAERNLFLRRAIDRLAETVGATDDEDQALRDTVHFLLDVGGKLGGGELAPALVEQDQVVACLERFEDEFALAFFLLHLAEVADVLHVGDDCQLEGEVMREAAFVFIDGLD